MARTPPGGWTWLVHITNAKGQFEQTVGVANNSMRDLEVKVAKERGCTTHVTSGKVR